MHRKENKMFKYIYYRKCKNWESGKHFLWGPPYGWANSFFVLLLTPVAFLGGALMDSDNNWTFILVSSSFIVILAIMYLSERFQKRMKKYTPPERFKRLDSIPLYCLSVPFFLLMFLWGLGGSVLLFLYVIEPLNLNGWLYNLLF